MCASDNNHQRDLLIALNACLDLPREAVCHLARSPRDWLTGDRQVAKGSRLTPGHIAVARSLAPLAPRLAQAEERRAELAGARILTVADRDYPTRLHDLDLPPPVLYLKGSLPTRPAIAIVGSRQADPYGIEAGEMFARALGEAGLTVVSGLARGVDSAAHRGALASTDGLTVAVQGRGIDEIYPRRNTRLAAQIVDRGALLSEFPIGSAPLPQNFPIRNRIIAALSVAVLVVQAAPRSGSLITARLGLELGRYVFAVPGPIFHQRAAGTNSLLADGALLAQRPRDVLEALPLAIQDQLPERRPDAERSPLAPGVASVVSALASHQSLSPEELSRLLSKPVAEVLTSLLELELSGQVRRYPGPVFHLRR